MPLSTETLQTVDSIARTSSRRFDGLAAYPPYPYGILRNATLTVVNALAQENRIARLIIALRNYERLGVFIHPKTAEFLLVAVDVYEGATARPMLGGDHDGDDDLADVDAQVDEFKSKLARQLDESPSVFDRKLDDSDPEPEPDPES